MKCTIIGLGEAGSIYAAALLGAGHEVSGFDPMVTTAPSGVSLAGSAAEAAAGADLVLVLTGAGAARPVARDCLPVMAPGSCYADLTSSSPGTMEELGRDAGEVRFADIAILGPVITLGATTPLMASGPGAEMFADVLRGIGAPVEVVSGPPGAAMAHKLLRSVFMKGLASVVIEAVEAGRAAGMEDWIRAQVAGLLAGDGQSVIDRFLTGTRKHAARRAGEMRSTSGYLAELGVPAEMTDASATAMARMAAASMSETVAS
jgi:3-hydroxyisobutyrate dehydrogenase